MDEVVADEKGYQSAAGIFQKIMDDFPEAVTAISQLSGLITDEEMSAMNFSVDQKGIKVQTVARDFLTKINLIN